MCSLTVHSMSLYCYVRLNRVYYCYLFNHELRNLLYGTITFSSKMDYKCLSILLTSMVYHDFARQTYFCAKFIPIPKGSKTALHVLICTEALLSIMSSVKSYIICNN